MSGHKKMEHHKRADGGKVKPYDAQGSEVEKEAEERKRGGAVKKKRADGGKVGGDKPKPRMDRPCRKDGGRVGSDKSPFTSARSVSPVVGHSTDD